MVNRKKKFIIPEGNAFWGLRITLFMILFVLLISGYLIVSTSSNFTQMGALFLLIAFCVIIIVHLNGGWKELKLRFNSINIKR